MKVKWRKAAGFEEYAVSTNGSVMKIGGKRKMKKILKPSIHKSGYLTYSLLKDGKLHTIYAHRLVAMTFQDICGKYFEGAEVDHYDRIRTNNNAFNLQWVTKKENRNREDGYFYKDAEEIALF